MYSLNYENNILFSMFRQEGLFKKDLFIARQADKALIKGEENDIGTFGQVS